LDGDLAVLDDYLLAHPEAGEKLQALAASGHLGVGPWVVLADEHAVSGETIVHNLQAGVRCAGQLGQNPMVVFLAPSWGHVPQLPQLLRQAGAEHALVSPGPSPAEARSAFWWRAPNGSSVRAEYPSHPDLARAGLPDRPDEATGHDPPSRATKLLEALDSREQGYDPPPGPLLWLYPTDLSEPARNSLNAQAESLAELMAAVNSRQDRYFLRVAPVQDYLQELASSGLPSLNGELRPAPAGNGWAGLFSASPELAASAAAAERALERFAEPLCALWLSPAEWPESELSLAWGELVRNSDWRIRAPTPGAGAPDPSRTRRAGEGYEHVAQLAGDAARRALWAATTAFSRPGPVAINPTARARSGLVQLGAAHAADLPWAQSLRGGEVLAWAHDVPAFGWAALRGSSGDPRRAGVEPVRAQSHDLAGPSLDNGLVHLAVSAAEGTFAINGQWGLDSLVDRSLEAPRSSRPHPEAAVLTTLASQGLVGTDSASDGGSIAGIERPVSVRVELTETGPLRGRLVLARRYQWANLEPEVRTEVELRAGEPLVRVTASFSNLRPGHQLRTVFPLPTHATSSLADSPFATTERPASPEASYPFRSFACSGGLVMLHDGLGEYEVLAGGWAVALTLLSSPTPPFHSHGPGHGEPDASEPWDPWECAVTPPGAGRRALAGAGADQLGRHIVRYAVGLGSPTDGPAGGLCPFELAEQAFVPLQVVQATGRGLLAERGSHLEVGGGQVQVSGLRRVGDQLELRAFNPSPAPSVVELPGRKGYLVDIGGRTQAAWEGSFPLAPWSIVTARIL
jgi:alpha-mannosidase